MKKRNWLMFSLFFGMAAFYLSSCNSNSTNNAEPTANPKDSAQQHNEAKFDKAGEQDAKAVVDAYSASLFEMSVSDSVKAYSMNDDVKSLASAMSEAHARINSDIRQLASKKTISLPAELSADQLDKIKSLKAKKDMDKEYVKDLVSDHKDAIALFQKSADNCTDTDIKSWFSNALPELRKHLDMAMTEEDKMKKK